MILLSVSIMFFQEKEKKAGSRAIILSLIFLIAGYCIFIFKFEYIVLILAIFWGALILSFFLPLKINKNITDTEPKNRIDERDIMFSRNELVPGTDRFNEYYSSHPENKILDDLFRKEPGLLSKDAKYYNPIAFKRSLKYYDQIEELQVDVDGDVNPDKTAVISKEISSELKKLCKDFGALDVGICECKPYHFYSIKGRKEDYGKEIEIRYKFAIAFTVEMNHEMVKAGPDASIVLESTKQYYNAGIIATKLAKHIRELGYDARAHIDSNYQLVCPLVAKDAGLGEIGRMGLLMTPKQGPRVRIGVVTTELELIPDIYKKQYALIDFCRICKKCAVCCPSQSISQKDPEEINGVKRWQINSESCFTFWSKAGTDCGRCMAVCPFSHPDNFLHNFIRWGISKSKVFRYLALYLDDFFYGKKPAPWPIPVWLKN
ncbi:4Fe-4S dicluster domain-containing protein [Bacteroidota bacterium]